jgi:hypothetical protein
MGECESSEERKRLRENKQTNKQTNKQIMKLRREEITRSSALIVSIVEWGGWTIEIVCDERISVIIVLSTFLECVAKKWSPNVFFGIS